MMPSCELEKPSQLHNPQVLTTIMKLRHLDAGKWQCNTVSLFQCVIYVAVDGRHGLD